MPKRKIPVDREPEIIDKTLRSQHLLDEPTKEKCGFKNPDIEAVRPCFPPEAIFRSFDPNCKPDSVSTEWVCFPATPFEIGFSYPFPEFTRSFFELSGLSYAQAMPMIWRTLCTVEETLEATDVEFEVQDLAALYTLTSHGSFRFVFKSRPNKGTPILKTTQNDGEWKSQYFFVKRSSIDGGVSLPKRWILTGKAFNDLAKLAIPERVEAFLALDL